MRKLTFGVVATVASGSAALFGCLVDVPGTLPPDAVAARGPGVAEPEPGSEDPPGSGGASGAGGGSGGTMAGSSGREPPAEGAGGNDASASGLPCDIDAFLEARCRSCHGERPRAPMSLLTYADLTAPAVSDPNTQVAALSLVRMQANDAPMPPGTMATVPESELAVFRAWLDAGLPRGECGSVEPGPTEPGAPVEPTPAQVICTSDKRWDAEDDDNNDGLDEEGPWMNPGRACISCHLEEEDEPILQIGGTVFPTLHEEDLCYGVDGRTSDARVIITDANGATFSLPLERTGNFSLRAPDEDDDEDDDDDDAAPRVRFPIRAKVVAGGRERMMMTPQDTGDCNSCHTEQGRNGAPGRILLP